MTNCQLLPIVHDISKGYLCSMQNNNKQGSEVLDTKLPRPLEEVITLNEFLQELGYDTNEIGFHDAMRLLSTIKRTVSGYIDSPKPTYNEN